MRSLVGLPCSFEPRAAREAARGDLEHAFGELACIGLRARPTRSETSLHERRARRDQFVRTLDLARDRPQLPRTALGRRTGCRSSSAGTAAPKARAVSESLLRRSSVTL